jgi:hypothetical protein
MLFTFGFLFQVEGLEELVCGACWFCGMLAEGLDCE